FKQLFAQVTNPPIDAIREECVTGTELFLGPSGDITRDGPTNCTKIRIEHPILDEGTFAWLMSGNHGFKTAKVSTCFTRGKSLEAALSDLFERVKQEIANGAEIICLSDRGADADNIPIPALLASSGTHHYLIRNGLRGKCSLVLESAEPREVHHFATLIGYGVSAVFPYGAFLSIDELVQKGFIKFEVKKAIENYIHAVVHGLLKVISKMGISCVSGYFSAQVFEAVGISDEVIDKYFTGTVTRFSGLSIEEIEAELLMRVDRAKSADAKVLPSGGKFQWKKSGEAHLYNPEAIHLLQTAVRNNDYELYKRYSMTLNNEINATLRSMLDFKASR
ncbi:MAG TPA: glutamate synthase central domain-containing protein, partial [Clostridia bacterium]|nr:glutamate synthase central domain-containing protein [Clostridia bacterium]